MLTKRAFISLLLSALILFSLTGCSSTAVSGQKTEVSPHYQYTQERAVEVNGRQGEIEGLSFDENKKELLVLYNRGARIILGMPSGFYDGYDREIHEVFLYGVSHMR